MSSSTEPKPKSKKVKSAVPSKEEVVVQPVVADPLPVEVKVEVPVEVKVEVEGEVPVEAVKRFPNQEQRKKRRWWKNPQANWYCGNIPPNLFFPLNRGK